MKTAFALVAFALSSSAWAGGAASCEKDFARLFGIVRHFTVKISGSQSFSDCHRRSLRYRKRIPPEARACAGVALSQASGETAESIREILSDWEFRAPSPGERLDQLYRKVRAGTLTMWDAKCSRAKDSPLYTVEKKR